MSERLTNRNESGIAYAKIPTNPSNMIDVGECYTGRIIDRLAAYEDTGLTPERIRAYVAELQNAFNILFESVKDIKHVLNELENAYKGGNTPATYHNPADVEALIMAREAIKAAWSDGSANAAMDKASDALAAIDKAIGGF